MAAQHSPDFPSSGMPNIGYVMNNNVEDIDDLEIREAACMNNLKQKNPTRTTSFKWAEWIDAAISFVKGLDDGLSAVVQVK